MSAPAASLGQSEGQNVVATEDELEVKVKQFRTESMAGEDPPMLPGEHVRHRDELVQCWPLSVAGGGEPVMGLFFVTNYRILFTLHGHSTYSEGDSGLGGLESRHRESMFSPNATVSLPLLTIYKFEKNSTRKYGKALIMHTKDPRPPLSFYFVKGEQARAAALTAAQCMITEDKEAHTAQGLSGKEAAVRRSFAFAFDLYRTGATQARTSSPGWLMYDPIAEFRRLGVPTTHPTPAATPAARTSDGPDAAQPGKQLGSNESTEPPGPSIAPDSVRADAASASDPVSGSNTDSSDATVPHQPSDPKAVGTAAPSTSPTLWSKLGLGTGRTGTTPDREQPGPDDHPGDDGHGEHGGSDTDRATERMGTPSSPGVGESMAAKGPPGEGQAPSGSASAKARPPNSGSKPSSPAPRRLPSSQPGTKTPADACSWRLSFVNANYALIPTYPAVLCVPASITDEQLRQAAAFRSRGRLPAVVYIHPHTHATISRAGQPLTGVVRSRSPADEALLAAIRDANSQQTLVIMDARPGANAAANTLRGAGFELADNYRDMPFSFLGIENIHAMRTSLHRIYGLCQAQYTVRGKWVIETDEDMQMRERESYSSAMSEDKAGTKWLQGLDQSLWMDHISRILVSARRVAYLVHERGESVLVHCSDGWDRTSQLTALAQILLDSHFRTIDGFGRLIEKEFCSFGHQFRLRTGHNCSDFWGKQRSPVFAQFIDCVYQLTVQFPTAFEYNAEYLVEVLDALYSGCFGTFLCDSIREREQYRLPQHTPSLWDHLSASRMTPRPAVGDCDGSGEDEGASHDILNLEHMTNPFYVPLHHVLMPAYRAHQLRFFAPYFFRWERNPFAIHPNFQAMARVGLNSDGTGDAMAPSTIYCEDATIARGRYDEWREETERQHARALLRMFEELSHRYMHLSLELAHARMGLAAPQGDGSGGGAGGRKPVSEEQHATRPHAPDDDSLPPPLMTIHSFDRIVSEQAAPPSDGSGSLVSLSDVHVQPGANSETSDSHLRSNAPTASAGADAGAASGPALSVVVPGRAGVSGAKPPRTPARSGGSASGSRADASPTVTHSKPPLNRLDSDTCIILNLGDGHINEGGGDSSKA